jgi:hypothetical protein
MSDDFQVNNPGLDADHAQLSQLIDRGVRIVEDLNPILNRMFIAVESSGVPLWQDLRLRWNTNYNEMMLELGGVGNASRNAHEQFMTGDNNAARCFTN